MESAQIERSITSRFVVVLSCLLLPSLQLSAQERSLFSGFGSLFRQSPVDIELEAYALLTGDGAARSPERAARLFEEAAESGRSSAMAALANMLWYGDGIPEDRERALRLFRDAAELGNAAAQFALGLRFAAGDGVDPDAEAAFMWMEAAAAQGDPDAIYSIGLMYGTGRGVALSREVADGLIVRAAEMRHPIALKNAASLLSNSADQRDQQRALVFLERVSSDDPEAAFMLGWIHLTAEDVPRDLVLAAERMGFASSSGNIYASLLYAQMFDRGLGVERDSARAEALRRSVFDDASPMLTNNLAWRLAVSPYEVTRNGPVAVAVMEDLLSAPELISGTYLDTLAAAYAESGRFDEAIDAQERAIEAMRPGFLTSEEEEDSAESYPEMSGVLERLELYRSRRAYREE